MKMTLKYYLPVVFVMLWEFNICDMECSLDNLVVFDKGDFILEVIYKNLD